MSVLVMFFGSLLVLQSIVMLYGAGYETWQSAATSLGVLWAGIVIVAAGRPIRETRVLIANPTWFAFAFLWGIMSVIGIAAGITQQDAFKIVICCLTELGAVYLLWRAVSPKFYSDEHLR